MDFAITRRTPVSDQYRLLLTQYHQVPTSTAFYWTNTIIYQPVPLHIDPVPLSINQYRPILTQYHHISTSAAFHWPSTAKYQPVPLHTDLVPPSINHFQPTLLLLGDYRLLHSLPWVLFELAMYEWCKGKTKLKQFFAGKIEKLLFPRNLAADPQQWHTAEQFAPRKPFRFAFFIDFARQGFVHEVLV